MDRTKAQVRAEILAARRAVSAQERTADAAALTHHLRAVIPDSATVCAYVPVGSEPGSADSLDALAARGVTVLLPIARGAQPLLWAPYRPGQLVPAPFGLREPAPPWLPAEGIADASVVLVPALAVDRRGVRLGRGAGFYDRSLGLAARDALLVAVVRDAEVVDELPSEAHDVTMTHVLTPLAGLTRLGAQPGE